MTELLGVTEFTERLISSLDAESSDQYERYNLARERGDWVEAVATALVSFKLRGASLALSRRIATPDARWNDVSLVPRLIQDALDDYLVVEPVTHEPATDYAAALAISEVLDAVLAIEQEFRALPQKGSEALGRIIIAAMHLGEEATVLELIAGGHWDEVARLRTRKVGRPKGYTGSEWSRDLRPEIQTWIDQNPTARQADLVRMVHSLLIARKASTGKHVPVEDSTVKRALKKMKEAGLIVVPESFRWGK